MAIEFFDGFEGGGLIKPEWSTSQPPTPSTGAPYVRTGTYFNSITSTNSGARLNLTASAKKTFGYALHQDSWAARNYGSFWGDAGTTQHLTVTQNATTGQLELRRGTTAGTLLATSTLVYPIAQTRFLEVQATIADAGGTCIVRVDEVEWINFTGDTKNAGTSTNIDSILFAGTGGAALSVRMDDLYVTNGTDDTANTGRADNGFLGDLKVERLLPTGNGATNQFVGSDGNSTDNYLLVDEDPVNTSDYVGSNTAGNRDLYALNDLAATTTAVYAIRAGIYAAKSDAGPAGIKTAIRESGGTVTVSSNFSLSTTYAAYHDITRPSKPGGGAWSVADVNGLQAGVEASAS